MMKAAQDNGIRIAATACTPRLLGWVRRGVPDSFVFQSLAENAVAYSIQVLDWLIKGSVQQAGFKGSVFAGASVGAF